MLKGLRRKINESIDEIEEQRLAGEVQSVQVVPRLGSPSLEITVSDGSGRAAAVFTGRRRLGGVDCGRRVLLEGVARQDRGRLLVVNPAYTIVE